ncbi:hypothetical protein V7x_30200 [Crateriforma conspicua]|uniref:Uncharacterized protein n=2 Tax=Planctomycetaceae TaxID=126 RepID=A0A5C6FYJ6_9PLAN|nr:hypothetical protein V7x_30200 [Crateriforma conspicua]
MNQCSIDALRRFWVTHPVVRNSRPVDARVGGAGIRMNRVTTDPIADESLIRRWRAGRIVMRCGRLEHIARRNGWIPVSVAQVWWQAKFARPDGDVCHLDFHSPRGMSGVLTLDYVLSGRGAKLSTVLGAGHVLNWVARSRGALVIVAHVSNASITAPVLRRLGWEPQGDGPSTSQWIRRFYDGYPPIPMDRYLNSGSGQS